MTYSVNPLLPYGLDKTQAAGAGATNFLALTDTPGGYVGNEGKLVVVNAAGDALEFLEKKCSYVHSFLVADWAGAPLRINIPQSVHELEADPNKIMMVYKSGTPNEATNVGVTISNTGDITLEAGIAFDGYVVISDGCGGSGGGGGTYSNATPTPATVGNIVAGATFSNQTMQQMWDALLYPYTAPEFSSFLINGQDPTVEVGDTVLGNIRTFDWSTINDTSIIPNSLEITDVTTPLVLGTGLINDGTEDLAIGGDKTLLVAGSYSWRITGQDTNLVNFSRDFSVDWRFNLYFGEEGAEPLDETLIQSLRESVLTDTAEGIYAFLGGGYKYICYPASFGTLTSFKDINTNFSVPFLPVYTVSITNSFGVTTLYNVHRSWNVLGGSISIEALY